MVTGRGAGGGAKYRAVFLAWYYQEGEEVVWNCVSCMSLPGGPGGE